MENLIGEYTHKVDLKRRMFIPSEFRISNRWVITAGLEKCLFLFPELEWETITKKISNLPLTKKAARSFLRIFLSRAKPISCDSQGRILIPQKLADYASISNECNVIGMINRIEIWNPDKWEKYSVESEKKYSDLAEELTNLDL
ncbi:MAG: division/cell wall cluster transcriptional repressor MraZ [Elusimicrobiota bacterium]